MDKREKKGLAIGAAFGAVAGVITGILFAPKSGQETRDDIKDAAGKTASKIQEEAKNLQEEAKDLLDNLEAKAKKTSGKASETAKQHANEAKHTFDNLKTVAQAFKTGKASDKDLDTAVKKARQAKKSVQAFLNK